jgi:hypothetical protein
MTLMYDGDLRARIKADFIKTIREHQGPRAPIDGAMLDALLDDAMFHIEARFTGNWGE